jgi:hypothetical protein
MAVPIPDVDTKFKEQAILNRVFNEDAGTLRVTSNASAGGVTYGISNIEETGTYKYYGFEDASGNWYIMRKTLATNAYLYSAGSSNYSTNWTNRASLSYTSYSTAF